MEQEIANMKYCKWCDETKSLDDFYKYVYKLGHISKCCLKASKYKTAGGYTWEYYH